MYKKTITYTDYDGNERKEDFFFNLNKVELMEMEVGTTGGMQKLLERVVQTQDTKGLVDIFKDIILRSYGERSADGKRFIKIGSDGHRLANDFAQTEAYSELFMELATDEAAATNFINGIIPQALAAEVAARG